jgi:Holliday junction resolvasome RuvABC endonuclease subunit
MSDMGLAVHQQQLDVAVSPGRRIIVPRGCGSWWGVDPSTQRVSIAYVSSDGSRGVATRPFASGQGPARLAEIHAETVLFAASLILDGWPHPGLIYIEQPSGKMDNPNLVYAVGVIQAAIAHQRSEAKIETVTSSHWKKVTCGAGNIFKPKKRGDTYGVLQWAQANGYRGSSWDEADALAIAECARREVALEER